jgi:hypothetical protein
LIAIDELDKMVQAEDFRKLLRDIKGIFEVPNVYFLVSVSDEAARSLSLGALAGRDEFNSSFYTVIEAKPGTPEELAELLERRSEGRLPREVALALAVLAGGNPREVLRLADLAARRFATRSVAPTGAEAAIAVLEDEALILRREVVTAASVAGLPVLTDQARTGAFTALPDGAFVIERFNDLAETSLLADMWTPDWSHGDGFELRFGEAWRRLMVHLAVASRLIEAPSLVRNPGLALQLRDAVIATTQSAHVGQIVLERALRVETTAPAVDRRSARRQLDQLARRYESIRSEMNSGRARTRAMDGIVAEIRTIAREAGLSGAEIADRLNSPKAGDRVVALAVIQATGEPVDFVVVLGAALAPPTPFEGYQALLALETLLPLATDAQRDEVAKSFDDAYMWRLSNDAPRKRLAERILSAIRGGAPALS